MAEHQTGWYQNDEGDVFHVLGQSMSDETIHALGEMVKAVKKQSEADALWQPQLGEQVRVKIDANFEYSNDEAALAFFRAGYVGTITAIEEKPLDPLKYRVEVAGAYELFGWQEIIPRWRKAE